VNAPTRIDLFKEEMKFSAAHFTIYSADVRENLHGHNFTLRVEIDAAVGPDGLAFDYRGVKQNLAKLCREFDEILLLPTQNPHLVIEATSDEVIAHFGEERLVFLKRDVRLLPLRNVSLEELALHILNVIVPELTGATVNTVERIVTRVSSGPGQWASSEWVAQ
jgi:6-pyruvoyltetrahydropterin/6-carboxytetrahydropterin synthase